MCTNFSPTCQSIIENGLLKKRTGRFSVLTVTLAQTDCIKNEKSSAKVLQSEMTK